MVAYFDNAATSWPKPESVYRAIDTCLRYSSANPGRSGHRMSLEAARIVFEARERVAALFSAPEPERIIFTLNATDALNMALKGLLRPGDHVITSTMEHNSVLRPLYSLRNQGLIELSLAQAKKDGTVEPEALAQHFRAHTALVVLTHASNVTGTINDIGAAARLAHQHGALILVDAAQTAGALPIDVVRQDIDLLAFTGHKSLYGPQGTGGLYVGPRADLRPVREGGTGSRSEELSQPEFLPDKLESGTPNTPGLAGLAAGVDHILSVGLEQVRQHELRLTQLFLKELTKIPEVTVYGPPEPERRVAIVSLNLNSRDPAVLARELDRRFGIMVRASLHCAPLAHRTIGTFPAGTVRFSMGLFNTEEEIAYVLSALSQLAKT